MITFRVTPEDYLSAHRLHLGRKPWVYLLAAAAIAAGIVLLVLNRGSGAIFPYGLIGAGAGSLIGHWVDHRYRIPKKVARLYRQYKGLDHPISISWDAEALEGRSEQGRGRTPWRDFAKVRENEQVLLLYVTDQLWHIYPKRAFSGAQLDEFRRHATQKEPA